jgi:hypothetical protein
MTARFWRKKINRRILSGHQGLVVLVEHWAASNVEPHSHTMSRSIGCSRARCGVRLGIE